MQQEVIEVKEGEEVKFIIGIEQLTAKIIDGEIRIYCDGTLCVTPWSTNSIRLRVED